MNNLIVTIIAIGLTAAMAGASIYYGGSAYMNSNANATANKYINYLNQITSVINLWSQRNGGIFPNPSASFPAACGSTAYCTVTELQSQNMLGSRYVGITSPPDGTDANELYYWNTASSAMQNPVLLLRLIGTSNGVKAACTAVETIRQRSTPAALRVYNGGTVNINRYMCANYGCFQNDGTFGATGTYLYIVYARIGGTPNTTMADYPTTAGSNTCPTS